ncbi:prohibitin family protein, partial [Fusobacterium ulcerans]|uniref:prohibitin family protein n=1 Tax=Fusobacterium ulcerans TaxID=861 RepID=UPI002670D75D
MKKQVMLGSIGAILILVFFMAFTSFYTVKTGEVAIISSWGKITRIDREGLNFKIPVVQTKEMLVTRDKIYSFDNMSVSTKDMQSIVLDLTVQSAVSDPEKLYRSFRGMHEMSFIIPRTKEVVQASISKYTIEEFVSKRQELSKIIYEDLKDDFNAYGLSVSNVSITNHDFSVEYEKAIEAKKVAEQEVERTRFEQEKFRVEAENQVLLAEYKLKEKELQAKANQVEAESLSPMLLKKLTIEKWNGKLPQIQNFGKSLVKKSLNKTW